MLRHRNISFGLFLQPLPICQRRKDLLKVQQLLKIQQMPRRTLRLIEPCVSSHNNLDVTLESWAPSLFADVYCSCSSQFASFDVCSNASFHLRLDSARVCLTSLTQPQFGSPGRGVLMHATRLGVHIAVMQTRRLAHLPYCESDKLFSAFSPLFVVYTNLSESSTLMTNAERDYEGANATRATIIVRLDFFASAAVTHTHERASALSVVNVTCKYRARYDIIHIAIKEGKPRSSVGRPAGRRSAARPSTGG